MRRVIVEIQREGNGRLLEAGQGEGFRMRRFKINPPAGFEQAGHLPHQPTDVAQMLHQMQACDCVHRAIRPRQRFGFKIQTRKLAARRIPLRLTGLVGGEQPEIAAQLGKVTEGFAIGRAQIQQGGVARRCATKRARVSSQGKGRSQSQFMFTG